MCEKESLYYTMKNKETGLNVHESGKRKRKLADNREKMNLGRERVQRNMPNTHPLKGLASFAALLFGSHRSLGKAWRRLSDRLDGFKDR